MRSVSLGLLLFLLWLALSGHYTPFLVGAGAATAIAGTLVARRMALVDHEGHPVHLLPAAATYWPWLIREIAKSAIGVTRIVLDPRLPISPTMTKVKAGQRGSVGIATYANSITLTPGTITVEVKGNELMVHALTRENALDLEAGAMDARVTRFEGSA